MLAAKPQRSVGLVVMVWLVMASGCAPWKGEWKDRNPLPAQRMSPDSVVLDVISVEIPPGSEEEIARIWEAIDQTGLPMDLRRRMADNGLRAGIASSQLPAELERLLDAQADSSALLPSDPSAPHETSSAHQRWQARLGKPHRYALTPVIPDLTWLVQLDSYVSGKSVHQAQAQAEVISYPQPDGKVRIDVELLIEHGQPQPKVDVNQGAFQMMFARDRYEFEELRVQAEMTAGQTLVISQTAADAGLGHVFFGGLATGESKKILLIRIAQTQLDDLFSREQIFAPIETPTE